MRRHRSGTGPHALLAALASLALAGATWANGEPEHSERTDPGSAASRLSGADSASEYWDFTGRFATGHRLFARFLITNEGPGERSAVAYGHLVFPDGRVKAFQNGRKQGRWELSDDGLRIRIGSSILDQRGATPKLEVDNKKRGVKIHLWYEPEGTVSRPAAEAFGGYAQDLLAVAAPVRGTVWVEEFDMPEPLPVTGTFGVTHTWMDRSESELALRRIDFFSLGAETAVFLSDVTAPDGRRARWLVVRRDGTLEQSLERFDLGLEPGGAAGDYPVPAALRVRASVLEGEIRLGRILLENDPSQVLPQPFRFLLSFKTQPHRVWADSSFQMRLRAGADPHSELTGSGITGVTFLNPLPAELSGLFPRVGGA